MHYWWLIFLMLVIALAHYAIVLRHVGILTLDGIFVATQLIMSVGTLAILEPSNRSDRLYAGIMFIAPVIYIAASMLIYLTSTRDQKLPAKLGPEVFSYKPKAAMVALAATAGLITILYFQAVGYSALLVGIQGLVTGRNTDITSLRLNSYSDVRYLFPGYVNQFKNTILPTLALVITVYLARTKHPLRVPLALPLLALSLLGLLGTGQRGAFIQFSLALLVFLYYLDRQRFRRRAAIAVLVLIPTLFVSTLLLGRNSTLLSDTTITAKAPSVFAEMFKRVAYDNQWSGQMGFRYTSTRAFVDGREWLQGILGILPGNSGSTLPRQIFEHLYGSDRGTAPPSLWGSVFYNFGWLGILVIPVILAVAYQTITLGSVRARRINTLELAGMAGTFVVLGNWVAGGPDYVLNAGGLTFIILWWFGRRSRLNTDRETPPRSVQSAAGSTSRRSSQLVRKAA